MSTKRPAAPDGCMWRGNTLCARIKVKGRDVWRSLKTDDVEIAKTRRAKLAETLKADAHFGDGRHTVEEAIPEFEATWQTKRETIGAKTMERYVMSLNQMPLLKALDCHQIITPVVKKIIDLRAKEVKTRTLKNDLVALSSFMDFCVWKEYATENPVPALIRQIRPRKRILTLPSSRDLKIIYDAASPRMRFAIDAALVTGCREDELVQASTGDIDDKLKQFTVTGKGGFTRTIDVSIMGGYDILKSVTAFLGSDVLFWQEGGKRYKHFASVFSQLQYRVFCRYYDKAHGTNKRTRPKRGELEGYEDRPGAIDIGFRRFDFHDYRHLHAVAFLKQGHGTIHVLQERLGHTSVKTTEIYTDKGCGFLTHEEKQRALFGTPVKAAAKAVRA